MNEIRCANCGRFLSYREIDDGSAHFTFEPDSHRGPEISEWECAKCHAPTSLTAKHRGYTL